MLAELYDSVGETAYSLAMRILDQPEEATLVVASAFSSIQEISDGDITKCSVQLLALVRQQAISRRHADRLREHQGSSSKRTMIRIPDAAHGSYPPVLSTVLQTRLRDALAELRPDERTAIELIYFEGLNQVEVADRLDSTAEIARLRVTKGMFKLRDTIMQVDR